MVELVPALELAGSSLGVFGALLLFLEFFQTPSYLDYDADIGSYTFTLSPSDVAENTWIGRVGALLVALAFALLFLATLLG